jgi:hypothetical protein
MQLFIYTLVCRVKHCNWSFSYINLRLIVVDIQLKIQHADDEQYLTKRQAATHSGVASGR